MYKKRPTPPLFTHSCVISLKMERISSCVLRPPFATVDLLLKAAALLFQQSSSAFGILWQVLEPLVYWRFYFAVFKSVVRVLSWGWNTCCWKLSEVADLLLKSRSVEPWVQIWPLSLSRSLSSTVRPLSPWATAYLSCCNFTPVCVRVWEFNLRFLSEGLRV